MRSTSSNKRLLAGITTLDSAAKANILKRAMALFMRAEKVEETLASLAAFFHDSEAVKTGDMEALEFVFNRLGLPFSERGLDLHRVAACFLGPFGVLGVSCKQLLDWRP